jgi:hypothetical protein
VRPSESRAEAPNTAWRTSRAQARLNSGQPKVSPPVRVPASTCARRVSAPPQAVRRTAGFQGRLVEPPPLGALGAGGDEHAPGLEMGERRPLLPCVGGEGVRGMRKDPAKLARRQHHRLFAARQSQAKRAFAIFQPKPRQQPNPAPLRVGPGDGGHHPRAAKDQPLGEQRPGREEEHGEGLAKAGSGQGGGRRPGHPGHNAARVNALLGAARPTR